MNIKKHTLLITCLLLLSNYNTIIKPMDLRAHSLKNGAIFLSIAVCIAGASYGLYSALHYFFPPKKDNGPKGTQTQRLGDITAKKSIVVTQKCTDGSHLEIGNVTSEGNIVISQIGGNSTKIGHIVSNGNVSLTRTTNSKQNDLVSEGIENENVNTTMNLSKKNIYNIKASGNGFVSLIQVLDDNEYVSLEADKDILNKLEMTIDPDDGWLVIGPKENSVIENAEQITYTVALKSICHVKLCGMINAYFATKINGNELKLTLEDDAHILCKKECPIETRLLTATCSGLSSVELQGNVSRQLIYLSGQARYQGKNLKSESTHIEACGSGPINLNGTHQEGTITGFVAGARNLQYTGNPDISKLTRRESATIKRIEQVNKSQ